MDERTQQTPVIALVGRTNVGKSTLFNRLLERRAAITSPIPGTTHDINFGHCHWRGQAITIIDTAGLDLTSKNATEAALKKQSQMAMDKADIIFLLVDVRAGLMPEDRAFALHLRKSKKKVFLIANKADNPGARRKANDPEWLKLGLGAPHAVSAANGTGTGDLLDVAWEELGGEKIRTPEFAPIDVRVAIIGRPNVGKSSLLNALAGEERVIVSEVPHTTKEPQDTLLTYEDDKGAIKRLLLIDTVGIRKKAHVEKGIEKIGVHMSLEELKRADVIFLMVDAAEGVGIQEKRLAGFVEDHNVPVAIIVNKWDLTDEKNLGTAEDYRGYIRMQFPSYPWAIVTFIAARHGSKVSRLIPMALEMKAQRDRILDQAELDAFTVKLKKKHHSMFERGGDRFGKIGNRPKVYGITQVGTAPPAFMVVVNDKETIHFNFLRFVENRLREEFGFEGTPIRVNAREIE